MPGRNLVLLTALLATLIGGFATVYLIADLTEVRVQQTIVAGVFLASGWVLTFLLRELSNELARKQSSIDAQEVFRAEIMDYSEALNDKRHDMSIAKVRDEIIAAGDGKNAIYKFVPRISSPVVFEARATDITLLPEVAIDNVVQFYSILSDVTIFAEDLGRDEFKNWPAETRANALFDYFELRRSCYDVSCNALADLEYIKIKRKRTWTIGKVLGVTPYDA